MKWIGRFVAIVAAAIAASACEQLIGLNEGKPRACSSASECAAAGPCAVATCVDGACGQEPVAGLEPCDDGDLCTENDLCVAGQCEGGAQKSCPAADACNVGVCDPMVGCQQEPANEGLACDDGVDCTIGDSCKDGVCVSPAATSCVNDDGCCPAGCTTNKDDDCPPLAAMAYDVVSSFESALPSPQVALAWDGANLWACSGGDPIGVILARYSPSGTPLAGYQPNIDFRALFTKGDGTSPLFARAYADDEILIQTSPGNFGPHALLSGGNLEAHSAVVYDADAEEFVTFADGVVSRWNVDGLSAFKVDLQGFGSKNMEGAFPQNGRVLYRSGYYLTYSNGTLSAWSSAGQRVSSSLLNGGGTSLDSHFSLSYAAGKVWVTETAGQTWLGYDVGL